jgi:hypothetical protein
MGDYVLHEVDVTPDDVEGCHGVEQGDIWLGRTRGTSGIIQCGYTEMMSMVDNEARKRQQEGLHSLWLPLLNYLPVCNVKLLFVSS